MPNNEIGSIMKLVLAEDSADLMRGNPSMRGFLIETGPCGRVCFIFSCNMGYEVICNF